jgi:uncharacterized protein (TIGR00156 family)
MNPHVASFAGRSRRRRLAATVLGASLAAFATGAAAQYTGPGARAAAPAAPLRSVKDVLASPADDRPVELTGTIVRQLDRETYVFSDGTGEIQVEIDREDFPADAPVAADTRVTIHGEVDTRLGRAPEIDVERLRIAG